MSTATTRDHRTASDAAVPRAWRWRSRQLAVLGLTPVVAIMAAVVVGQSTDNRILSYVIIPLLVFVVVVVASWLTSQGRFILGNDPILREVEHREDGSSHWSGRIAPLGNGDLEKALHRVERKYPRLRFQSVGKDGQSAKLSTKAGWHTIGTDISIRRIDATSPQFEIVNVPALGLTADPAQQRDDLARLVYLLHRS